MADPIELFAFDRDVRRAAERLEKQRQWLASGLAKDLERARNFDPFDVRAVASKATYDTLAEMKPSELDVPLRDALLRWVHELLQARVGSDLAIDDAEAENELDPQLTQKQIAAVLAEQLAREAAPGPVSLDGRDVDANTYKQALRAILTSPNDARAAAALLRAGELAAPVSAVRKERKLRRFEAARRLGFTHPWQPAAKQDLRALANTFLDTSEGFASALFKEKRKGLESPWRASSAMQLALGHGAKQGWPAYLGTRWLDESFVAIAPRGVPLAPPPPPLGSASFVRAATAWGFAFRVVSTPRSMPFALSRDPYPVSAYRFGFTFGTLVTETAFQRRVLDLPVRTASAQSRVLKTTLFLHARTLAARAILSADESTSAALFEEITARVFGAPLPASMRDAWPAPRPAEPAQLLALFGARAFGRSLVERYDEDWFLNPKVGQHLLGMACGPAFDAEMDAASEGAPMELARAFEEALG